MANQNSNISAYEKALEKFNNYLKNMSREGFIMYMRSSKNIICL